MTSNVAATTVSGKRHAILGMLTVILLLGGFGSWATFANIEGATISRGRLSQSRTSRDIQHLTGGLVVEIAVVEGQKVEPGAVILRLDASQFANELATLESRSAEISTRIFRLIAERDDLHDIPFPDDLLQIAKDDAALRQAMEGQTRLFSARREAWQQEIETLQRKAKQVSILTEGIDSQIIAYEIQKRLKDDQLEDALLLRSKGLVSGNKLHVLEYDIAALDGKIGVARSEKAQAMGRISEIELEILRGGTANRETAIEQLRDLEFRQAELLKEQRRVRDLTEAQTLTAPIGGVVLGLGSVSKNTVIEPAEILMQIVPQDTAFIVDARISPEKIGQIYPGQPVRMSFANHNLGRPMDVQGRVSLISADTLIDPGATGPYFQVQITPSTGGLESIQAASDIFPGMICDLFFSTGEQPVWTYLAKPFLPYFNRALRES